MFKEFQAFPGIRLMVDQRCMGWNEIAASLAWFKTDLHYYNLHPLVASEGSGACRSRLKAVLLQSGPTWIEESYHIESHRTHIVSFSIHLRTHYADGKKRKKPSPK